MAYTVGMDAADCYYSAFVDECEAAGEGAAAGDISVGWPNNTGPDTPADWGGLPRLKISLERARRSFLFVHEYWCKLGPDHNWKWWAGRILWNDWKVRIIIGECGIDQGVVGPTPQEGNGWMSHMGGDAYAAQLFRYEELIRKDPRVFSIEPFCMDFSKPFGTFDCRPILPQLIAHGLALAPLPEVRPSAASDRASGARLRRCASGGPAAGLPEHEPAKDLAHAEAEMPVVVRRGDKAPRGGDPGRGPGHPAEPGEAGEWADVPHGTGEVSEEGDFQVVLRRRDLGTVMRPGLGVSVRVLRYGWNCVGGPSWAALRVSGPSPAVWEAAEWLRCGVEVYSPLGEPVWWGYANGLYTGDGAVAVGVGLDDMANRVAARYLLPGSGWGSAADFVQTAWAENADSVAEFGSKERVLTLTGSDVAFALALRDAELARAGLPPVRIGAGGVSAGQCDGVLPGLVQHARLALLQPGGRPAGLEREQRQRTDGRLDRAAEMGTAAGLRCRRRLDGRHDPGAAGEGRGAG